MVFFSLFEILQWFFFSLFEILQTLYWSMYGLIELDHTELKEKHEVTELIGKLMFGSYSWIAFIVLLNLLIAMMSNSYQNISVSIILLLNTLMLGLNCNPGPLWPSGLKFRLTYQINSHQFILNCTWQV